MRKSAGFNPDLDLKQLKKLLAKKEKEISHSKKQLEIEAALEKVRASSLAMHKSEELIKVAKVLYKELKLLGLNQSATCAFVIIDEKESIQHYYGSPGGKNFLEYFKFSLIGDQILKNRHEAWKRKDPVFSQTVGGKKLQKHLSVVLPDAEISEVGKDAKLDMPDPAQFYFGNFTYGYLQIIASNILSEDQISLLPRFAKVFEQAYTRFLDLQKAEAQALEAQIETALERVRSRTMAMHKSQELSDVATVLFQQMSRLKLEPVSCALAIFNEKGNSSDVYFSIDGKVFPESLPIPNNINQNLTNTFNAWKKGEKLQFHDLQGEEARNHDKSIINYLNSKGISLPLEAEMVEQPRRVDYHAFFSHGMLLFSYTMPIDKTDVLVRFAKVFEQAYLRFLDIQKAEAQAREAQIEVALERVRSRTMAMQHSDELIEVVNSIFNALKQLDYNPHDCTIFTFDFHEEVMNCWSSIPAEKGLSTFQYVIPIIDHPFIDQIISSFKKKQNILNYHLAGEEKESYDDLFFQSVNFPEMEAALRAIKALNSSFIFMSKGALATFTETSISEKDIKLLERFSKVVDLSYSRFLDLQKAEVQAREAQIEAAIERVRSASMAMHKSEELANVASVCYQELISLGAVLKEDGFHITLFSEDSEVAILWMTEPGGTIISRSWELDLKTFPPSLITYQKWKEKPFENRNEMLTTLELSTDEIQALIHLLSEHPLFSEMPITQEWILNPPSSWIVYDAFFSNGTFVIDSFSGPKKSESLKIHSRFAKVFEQTYTRFLDLKKAEIQAREAQIEAALERIRSASMAMHKSEELPQVALTFLIQIEELAIPVLGVALSEINIETNTCITYFADNTTEDKIRELFISKEFEINEFWLAEEAVKQMKSGKKEFTITAEGEQLELWIEWIDKIFSKKRAERLRSANLDKVFFHTYPFHEYSSILFSSLKPLSEEYRPVIQRLVSTFKLSYLRFLDLQKAEAQSRESEIQLALERVRARTMAMQNSSELAETASVLFEQLRKLDSNLWSCGFVLCEKDNPIGEQWMSVAGGGLLPPQYVPHEHEATHHNMYKAWEDGIELYSEVLQGGRLREVGDFLMTIPSVRKNLEQLTKAGFEFPAYQKMHAARFSNGYLLIITIDDFKDTGIFIRFAKVFDQTYTRFLDLKKAEEQAREAQIEAALERIRNRALIMQDSSELNEVVSVFFNEFSQLDLLPPEARTYFCDIDTNTHVAEVWMTYTNGEVMSTSHITPLTRSASMKKYYEAWRRKEPISIREYKGKNLDTYISFVSSLPHVKKDKDYKRLFKNPPNQIFMTDANFMQGNIGIMSFNPLSEEALEVLQRFAKVFEFTYTRFLDLKKAEAQARESEIQLALERVRARTMAMHKSQELREVVAVLYEQMIPLGIATLGCELILCDEQNEQLQYWSAVPEQTKLPECYPIPKIIHPFFQKVWKAWKKRTPRLVVTLKGQEKRKFDKLIFEKTAFKNFPESAKKSIQEGKVDVFSFATMKYGLLEAVDVIPLSEHKFLILERFANVFEQTYTRFLDLQKAEAQAREAQIEVALERVRASSMAMHRSEELPQVAHSLLEQLDILGISDIDCGINIVDSETKNFISYSANSIREGNKIAFHQFPEYNLNDIGFLRKTIELVDAGKSFYTLEIRDELFEEIIQIWKNNDYPGLKNKHLFDKKKVVYLNAAQFSGYSSISTTSINPLSEEQMSILQRMAKTFAMSYTRFLDLQKAEAQAREAQIEAALERIRARALAMHHSEELEDVAHVLREQMRLLDQPELDGCVVELYEVDPDRIESWYAFPRSGNLNGEMSTGRVYFAKNSCAITREMIEKYKSPEKSYTIKASGEKLAEWNEIVLKNVPLPLGSSGSIIRNEVLTMYYHCSDFSGGTLLTASSQEPIEVVKKLQARAASVFDLAYKRFLDLQKAEAQAREGEIQLALERVRAQTMAMHSSKDMGDCILKMFSELTSLGVDEGTRFGIGILNHDNENNQLWTARKEGEEVKMHIGNLDMTLHPLLKSARKAWKEQVPLHRYVLEGDDLLKYYQMINTAPDYKLRVSIEKLPEREFHYGFIFDHGFFYAFSLSEFQQELIHIAQRFSAVFEQTYRRFLDLKKAEAQAREAQIEAALERVRSRTMAMQQSSELNDISVLLYKEIMTLGVSNFFNCGYFEMHEDEKVQYGWLTREDGTSLGKLKFPLNGDHTLDTRYDAWKKQKPLFHQVLNSIQMKKHIAFISPHYNNKEADEVVKLFPNPTIFYNANFKHGYLHFNTGTYLDDEGESILIRFTQVFAQTYTRFLDLQKAEAQAREAQIEAGLERVRSHTSGMRNSDELLEVGGLLYEELEKLGITSLTAGYVIMDEQGEFGWNYVVNSEDGSIASEPIGTSHKKSKVMGSIASSWRKKEKFNVIELGPKETIQHQTYIAENSINFPYSADELISFSPERLVLSSFNFRDGYLLLVGGNKLQEDQLDVLIRFAKVFEQTYTRFLDLQKAEAQAREAEIEAALERIRSTALAMQSSADLHGVSIVLRDQMGLLGQPDLESSIVHLYNKSETLESWYTFKSTETKSDKTVTDVAIIPVDSCDYIKETLEKYHSKETEYTIVSNGKKLRDWYNVMVKVAHETIEYDDKGKMIVPEILYYHHSKFSGGALLMISNQPPSEESKELQKRAAKVFNFAYQRFLDLKNAEAQAREAQIEASLEKIRARAMAMQKSDELREVVGLVSEELNISLENTICIIMNFDWKHKEIEWWSTGFNVDNLPESYKIPIHDTIKDHPLIRHYREAVKKGISYIVYKLEGEIKRTWDDYIFEQSDLKKIPLETQNWMRSYEGVICNEAFMSHGVMEVDGPEQLSEEKAEVLQRFAKVVDLTYKRIEDLQQAEARAVEAVRQASLDRVRGEIASMRTKEDLNRITPLIWKELTALQVPFIRCGVMIMDEERKVIQSFLSAPDGHSLGVFDLPFESEGIAPGAYKHWKSGTIYKDHWNKKQFAKFTENLVNQGLIKDRKLYTGASTPPESLDLHFVPFKQGMLYVGNTEPLAEDAIQLAESLAKAFSIAYARYEDFIQLEQAKNQIEQALAELKSTQTQLIHAEKMASLGELTAGIAHEIQNPLNFVNNFSEVSQELIEELREERIKKKEERDEGLEEQIIDDIIQNLVKINHHGQRASSIVKGMLEHSRTGQREKELTDLNVLADEYLRLAYHGLRAKDKSFSADFKTNLDKQLPKLKVISQDIGRVLLNLINNAFYAVSKKSKEGIEGYKPEVIVCTRRNDKTVEICVQDNGGGIPKDALDKIFQPFFTTKPTGEGTGLGLSLSYDIVTKGHDGHLEVETEEDMGTRFVIQLPIV